jgi:hypothetical protein
MLTLINGASGEERTPTLPERIFWLVGHEVVALFTSFIGGWIGITALTQSEPHKNHFLLFTALASQFNPGFLVPAFFVGFVINYHARNRSACWLGLINSLLLSITVVADAAYEQNRAHFGHTVYCDILALGNNRCDMDGIFARLVLVGPVLGSIAYSLGSLLALRYKKESSVGENKGPAAYQR